MPNVGSAANYQVNHAANSGESAEAIRASIKAASTSNLITDFRSQVVTLEKYLTEARQKMLDTGRAALRQEIRKVEAILASKDYTVLVADMPEVRFLGNKSNNDLVRDAKVLLQTYNTVSSFFYSPTKQELLSRGVDPYDLSISALKEGTEQEVDQAAVEELKKALSGKTTFTDQTTYWIIGILMVVVLIKRRNAKR